MRFFKNFKGHMPMVFTIIAFLFIQAMCDLSLPDYTASLIDTGIIIQELNMQHRRKFQKESYRELQCGD